MIHSVFVKNWLIICVIRKFVVTLHSQMMKVDLSKDEEELIAAIRNYRASFPNGHPQLLWYAVQCFDKLVDLPE